MYDHYFDDIYDVDNFLAHHGVKGQKWGIRRARKSSGGKKKSANKTKDRKSLIRRSYLNAAGVTAGLVGIGLLGYMGLNKGADKLIDAYYDSSFRKKRIDAKREKFVKDFINASLNREGERNSGSPFARAYANRKRKEYNPNSYSYSQANRHMKDLRKAYNSML